MKKQKEKILVTGGAGFIASHIVDAYLAKGYSVVIVDDLSKGFKKNLNPKAKFYKTDITDLAALRRVFRKERPDIVNHHAAIAVVAESMRDPIPTMESNVIGTTNVLVAAGEAGVKKVLFASSAAVYGDPKRLPIREHAPTRPISPYGLSKLLGEETIKFYALMFGFDYLIFRYANVYGPRQNAKGEGGVVAIFSDLMRQGKQATIFGDGKKTRDYVYVEDIVKANVLGLAKGADEIINISRGVEVSDRTVYDTIATNLRYDGVPLYAPHREGDIVRSVLCASRAAEVIGWKPDIDFKKGIALHCKDMM
ncbi:hypothetical protein A2333_02805 [Candidatus Wolfebacteria bacterium RIFOXYB2_FULL_49_7]|uniref:NAD-dependent epimerase/dehydratase domain-containing protein n=1 Tax=Candidatus Wolfebacteria bacterium RIFOXYB1_FULL_54_12 TaxID=1802559 RepID=A0A1F8DXQ7_9BACT|nr:MAG: hypothetical protein A2372_02695 [Candidatus Wolfebacteria bacterium RIFOXYB1_FULL_54_12]OGM96181.1 MAG: hypothetical protein A2333_02805 [Candidatus Wolfebacteria bacterium RIFOXYB2_FULL_49_7]